MSAGAPPRPSPALPPGWLPEGEVVEVYARRRGGTWTAETKPVRVATTGETSAEAADNALRELYDLLSREAHKGRSYDDVPKTSGGLRVKALFLVLLLLVRLSDREILRVPLRVVEEREALRETVEVLQDEEALDLISGRAPRTLLQTGSRRSTM